MALFFNETTISNLDDKQKIAEMVAGYARDGDIIGAGSGSSAYVALTALASTGKDVTCVPTSIEIEMTCKELGIKTTAMDSITPNWCFDGADAVDENGDMIKGRGGAMLREKNVMRATQGPRFILIDQTKRFEDLTDYKNFPIELTPPHYHDIVTKLGDMGAMKIEIRQGSGKDGPTITEHGNIILDVRFDDVTGDLNDDILAIDGVVETGLFFDFAPIIILPDTIVSRD